MLQLFDRLHKHGASHWNYWHHNIFLHFAEKSKFPHVYLCDVEHVGKIDVSHLERELADLFINISYLMGRRYHGIMDSEDAEIINPDKARGRSPKFSSELLRCREVLGEMCLNEMVANFGVAAFDIPQPAGPRPSLKELQSRIAKLRASVTENATKVKAKCKSLPDLRTLRGDDKSVKPKLYDYPLALLEDNVTTAGPFKIVAVDPHSFRVLGVCTTEFNLHRPDNPARGGSAFDGYEDSLEKSSLKVDLNDHRKSLLLDAPKNPEKVWKELGFGFMAQARWATLTGISIPDIEPSWNWRSGLGVAKALGLDSPIKKEKQSQTKMGKEPPSKKSATPKAKLTGRKVSAAAPSGAISPDKPAGVSKAKATTRKVTTTKSVGTRQSGRLCGKDAEVTAL